MAGSPERRYLLDVSRLVWRVWRGGLPTGIDRVCLAYLEQFEDRSLAVVQRSGVQLVLSASHSAWLFRILREAGPAARRRLIMLAASAGPRALRSKPTAGSIYLNVGHTGLNEPSLPAWVRRHRLRAVYLIHDLIPLTHPQFCRAGEAAKHEQRMDTVLSSAAGVIGNSQATLDELAMFARARGVAMPASLPALISGIPAATKVLPRMQDRPYFVTVGTIEGRKNHKLLLEVWRSLVSQLGANAPMLVIIGTRGWQAEETFEQLDRLGDLAGHVWELGRCGDEQLAAWIAGARAVLMPSFAEGFGLPVIEALQLGTPVIATDLPVYREIAGEIPCYLKADDCEGWKQAVVGYCTDDPDRVRQVSAAQTYVAPSWPMHFDLVERWLDKL
ncbi:glycosyltransferase family 4 protein [Sphingomonas sp. BN140010]|uniref:Glycosyltransferase family 4 protein n=1 Tax=Sphingomonas arvum TaxID=2992113 RepID=A0ABT3JC84_9SPHN|nr:glycosyltransferase family 1 protein [Sphingomonas sp. BN140010]MCW3796678.1 glycosyltransferase family 4 protein [Sphingomonas sp. BN140010]